MAEVWSQCIGALAVSAKGAGVSGKNGREGVPPKASDLGAAVVDHER